MYTTEEIFDLIVTNIDYMVEVNEGIEKGHLTKQDGEDIEYVFYLLKEGNRQRAMDYYNSLETLPRNELAEFIVSPKYN